MLFYIFIFRLFSQPLFFFFAIQFSVIIFSVKCANRVDLLFPFFYSSLSCLSLFFLFLFSSHVIRIPFFIEKVYFFRVCFPVSCASVILDPILVSYDTPDAQDSPLANTLTEIAVSLRPVFCSHYRYTVVWMSIKYIADTTF